MYVVPILAAASWFGSKAGVPCAILSTAVYWLHVASWPAFLLVDVTQAAMMSAFVVVAAVTGALVERRQQERSRRVASDQRAERAIAMGTLSALMIALAARDEGTLAHGERVSRVASAIGLKLGLEPERLDLCRSSTAGRIELRREVEREARERLDVRAASVLAPALRAEERSLV